MSDPRSDSASPKAEFEYSNEAIIAWANAYREALQGLRIGHPEDVLTWPTLRYVQPVSSQ